MSPVMTVTALFRIASVLSSLKKETNGYPKIAVDAEVITWQASPPFPCNGTHI